MLAAGCVAVGAAAPAFGMRPGVMAGAAAVCAVPLGVFVSANGPELLPFVVLLAAAIEGVVGALRLYEGLGFVRDKRLPRYYLNGNDAFRLKVWFHDMQFAQPAQEGAVTDSQAAEAPPEETVETPADGDAEPPAPAPVSIG